MGLSMGHFGLKHTRDRLAGDQRVLARQKQKLQAKVTALVQEIAGLDIQLQEKAEQVQAINVALTAVFDDQSVAEARQTFPKKHFTPWGGLTRGAAAILREANGAELTTNQIADELARRAGLELPTPQDARGFRRAVRKRLGYLSLKGGVERLHEAESGEVGRWRVKASSE